MITERSPIMEQSINRVELLGRTGNRPTLRHKPNGTPVTQFSLYTNQLWRNAFGELCEAAERHSITAWGQLAIQCCDHLHKGSRVHVTGRLQTRRWDDPDTGEVRLRTESSRPMSSSSAEFSRAACRRTITPLTVANCRRMSMVGTRPWTIATAH
jgi:single-strand DNA-binding protein